MNKRTQKRRREIIHALCEMSRNGWRDARPCDYEPLERELREIERPWTLHPYDDNRANRLKKSQG